MKEFNLRKRISATVAKMKGYTPGEQPQGGGWVKLNTNEFPYAPSPKVKEAILKEIGNDGASLRLYPDPNSSALRAAIGKYFGVPASHTFAANGSDDLLNVAVRAFSDSAKKIATIDPSYSLYPVLAKMQGSQLVQIPFGSDNTIDFDAIFKSGANIFFFTNPNAPTGVGFGKGVVEKICEGFKGLVLVDEAYAPFCKFSAAKLVKKYPNLLVTGTSSKGWALAGMRIGWGVANPAIIEVLDRVRDSYNLDRLAQAAGVAALEDENYYETMRAKVVAERESVEKFFDELGWTYPKSSSNFVLVKPFKNGKSGAKIAAELFDFLRSKKILVRYFPKEKSVCDALRMTVGTREQMDAFKSAAREWAQK